MKRLALSYGTAEALRSDHLQNLASRRAFITGATGVGERELCEIVIGVEGTGDVFVVPAEVVWITPAGVGFALTLDAEKKAELAAFVEGACAKAEAPSSAGADAEEDAATGGRARNIHDRIRAQTLAEREETARRGSLPERVALERAFGGSVWEGLLQNPQLTVTEVARIAKNGTLSKALVATIIGNGAWLASSEVQRALLANPRCTGTQLERVLLAMKKSDLARLAQSCPYRPEVKSAVLRLVTR